MYRLSLSLSIYSFSSLDMRMYVMCVRMYACAYEQYRQYVRMYA